MSRPDDMPIDLDTVIRAVVEAVLSRLAADVPAGGAPLAPVDSGSCVGWLLAAPLGHAEALLGEMRLVERLGHAQRILCTPEAAAALGEAGGLAGLSRASLVEAGASDIGPSAWLAAAAGCDVLVVASLAWHQARAAAELDDRDPAVAVMLDALGAGRAVRMLCGEGLGGLHRFGAAGSPAAPGGGTLPAGAGGALASEAARLWRSLAALGALPLRVDAVAGMLRGQAAEGSSFTKALGGLLAEKDVEQAAQEGRRELTLPKGVVITPLARDRARALGIRLVEAANR